MVDRHCIRWSITLFIAVLVCGPVVGSVHAQSISFVDGIWMNQDTITTDDTTRIYVALRNSATFDITGTLELHANDIFVGSTTVAALPGRLIESWVDWQPQHAGSYQLVATITDTSPSQQSENAPSLTLPRVVVTKPLPTIATTTSNESDNLNSVQNINTELQERFANQGFEQFIPNSPPRRWLEIASQQIETTQASLANYETRLRENQRRATNSTTTEAHQESSTLASQEIPHIATTTVGTVVLTPILDWLKTNLNNVYIHTISGLRWLFSHPILIQILFLVLILWLIYRTARYIGKRST